MRSAPALAAVIALLAGGCGGNDEGSSDETTATATEAARDCHRADAPAPRRDGGETAPTARLDAAKTYRLVFSTNCGSFTVTLDEEAAPKTSASLVALARSGYFDRTIFHRIVPGFVIQGGDPTQSGGGGPGYATVDVPPSNARYVRGAVAMAKTAAEPPGTAGSQFFVVLGDDIGLAPEYAIVGEVTDGLDVVDLIGTLGDASEQPTQTVLIEKVTVEES